MFGWTFGEAAAVRRRKLAFIHAYCGSNSAGKSLAMVTDGLAALRAGVPILSNMRIHDVNNPRPCEDDNCRYPAHDLDHPDHARHMAAAPNWIPFRTWADFLDFSGGEVWADEITDVASSDSWSQLPTEAASKLQALRRGEIVWRQTSPDFARTDKKIREVVQAVTVCHGRFSRQLPGHVWRSNQLFVWMTFDARLLTDVDNQMKNVRAQLRQVSWRPQAFTAYDTYAPVIRLDHVHQGTCLRCHGKIPQPRCSCEPVAEVPGVSVLPTPRRAVA
jgi:hypothetical protein